MQSITQPVHSPSERCLVCRGENLVKALDVRRVQPKDRHPMIHRAFDELQPGESLTLINDHDPVPLYYELAATKPDFDASAYTSTEEEPDKWVAILKKKP